MNESSFWFYGLVPSPANPRCQFLVVFSCLVLTPK